MALTKFNEPKFQKMRVAVQTPLEDDDTEAYIAISVVGLIVFIGCVAYIANFWSKNEAAAR
jgi:hypothetical protein